MISEKHNITMTVHATLPKAAHAAAIYSQSVSTVGPLSRAYRYARSWLPTSMQQTVTLQMKDEENQVCQSLPPLDAVQRRLGWPLSHNDAMSICLQNGGNLALSMLSHGRKEHSELARRRKLKRLFRRLGYGQAAPKVGERLSGGVIIRNRETGLDEEERSSSALTIALMLAYGWHLPVHWTFTAMTTCLGRFYQTPQSKYRIKDSVKAWRVNTTELAKDISEFNTYDEFFYRALKPGSRPMTEEVRNNTKIAVSPADCRMTVFPTVDLATKLWIKGRKFNLASLLNDTELAKQYVNGSLGIFRLAPEDYHRFHFFADGEFGPTTHIEGKYMTVQPVAINSERHDVFTENRRAVTVLNSPAFGNVTLVTVGATLVGSVNLSPPGKYKRGDEMGFFKHGGSTLITIFPPGFVWSPDLLMASVPPPDRQPSGSIETLVKVGMPIGALAGENYNDTLSQYAGGGGSAYSTDFDESDYNEVMEAEDDREEDSKVLTPAEKAEFSYKFTKIAKENGNFLPTEYAGE